MIIDGKSLKTGAVIHADVCILGGGVAGIVIAKELSKTMKKVVLVESGSQNYSYEIQKLYSSGESTNAVYPDTTHSRLRFLGGSSNHWENNTSPLDAIDFEKRDWIENSGWPISFEDIQPYYPEAAIYCGVGDDGYHAAFWTDKLAVTDIVSSSAILDTGVAKAASPPTRFFASYGDELLASETLRIFTNSNVVDLDFESSTKMVRKAFIETSPGLRYEVRADTFIMCCGGIENARLLLHFNQKYGNKLGNNNDNVGRYFMDHPMVRGAHFYPHEVTNLSLYEGAKLKDKVVIGFLKLTESSVRSNKVSNVRMPLILATNYAVSDGISSHHIMADAFKKGELPDAFGTHILNFLEDIDMVAEAASRQVLDKKIFDHADHKNVYQIAMMVEQSPARDNRIKLSKSSDIFGVPKVEIEWKVKQEDKDRVYKTLDVLAAEVGAKGLGRIRVLRERHERIWGDQMGFGHHHMGTTRMGLDEKEGVVDSNLKVFGTNNFFISGSSVFPTGGHVPPTLTIVALSIRLARYLSGRN